jgi:hypothetical protein
VRGKLKRFPEVVKADIDRKKERAYMWAKPAFYAYVALEHSLEEAGGAIQMFHPKLLVPQAIHGVLGVKDNNPNKIVDLEARLAKVPHVRTAIVDPDRWFKNDKGLDVGGAVIFADKDPQLELNLVNAAKEVGFIFEPATHGHGGPNADEHDEWSEMNHAFSGVCLLFLAALGMLQVALARPPWFIKYGAGFIWLALFVFLFIRSDRSSWPLGPISWWDGFKEWDTAQHRAGTGMIFLVGAADMVRVRNNWQIPSWLGRWGMLVLGIAGSALLFRHLHTTIDPTHYAIVRRMNAQHMAMATFALLFALSKFAWDTWKVPARIGPYLWLIFLGCLGLVLTLYVE